MFGIEQTAALVGAGVAEKHAVGSSATASSNSIRSFVACLDIGQYSCLIGFLLGDRPGFLLTRRLRGIDDFRAETEESGESG